MGSGNRVSSILYSLYPYHGLVVVVPAITVSVIFSDLALTVAEWVPILTEEAIVQIPVPELYLCSVLIT